MNTREISVQFFLLLPRLQINPSGIFAETGIYPADTPANWHFQDLKVNINTET